jgi:LmbE family N-acetylglucosaminyl deacetylase
MTEQRITIVEPLREALRIVAIVAHHDDIEFGMAGTIARWVEEGAQVTYIIITDGGSGSNKPGVIRAELAELRRQEQVAAAAVVGVHDVRFLGYPDGTLQPSMELRKDLTRLLRELKPDRVMCQDPTTVFWLDSYINHPDHRAAGEAAVYATFPSSETRPIFPELLDEGYEPHKVKELWMTLSANPTHCVDITRTLEKKIDSLRCHVSQIGQGEDAENGALKYVRERNAGAGQTAGVEYAEFFRVMMLVRANEEVRDKDLQEDVVAREIDDDHA